MRSASAGGVLAARETRWAVAHEARSAAAGGRRQARAVLSSRHVRVELLARHGGVMSVHQALRGDAGRESARIREIWRSRRAMLVAASGETREQTTTGCARGAGHSAPAIMVGVHAGVHLVQQARRMRAIMRAASGHAGGAGISGGARGAGVSGPASGASGAGQSSPAIVIRIHAGIHLVGQAGRMRTIMRAGGAGAGQSAPAITIRVDARIRLVR